MLKALKYVLFCLLHTKMKHKDEALKVDGKNVILVSVI